jgi:hypothetical protein
MTATCANPDLGLNSILEKPMVKEAGLASPSEAVLPEMEIRGTSSVDTPPVRQRDSFLVILLRALGTPHF